MYKNQLIVFIGLAGAVGTFGIIESAYLSSFVFFVLGIANYAMAAFFAFKYFTYGRGLRKSQNSHEPRNKRSDKRWNIIQMAAFQIAPEINNSEDIEKDPSGLTDCSCEQKAKGIDLFEPDIVFRILNPPYL